MILVGISGKKQSGKNTVAKMLAVLARREGVQTVEFAFADDVKRECAAATGMPIEFMEQHKDVFRPLYQWWGTDFRRQFFGRDYWTRKTAAHLGRVNGNALVCVTDLRFPDEVECILGLGGEVLRVIRPGMPTDGHQSETALDGYQWQNMILNDGDLKTLGATVQLWFDVMIRPKLPMGEPIINPS